MSAWDELLAATHPGRVLDAGPGGEWLVLRRSYTTSPPDLSLPEDAMTITVELVRTGSTLDPRRPPADTPRPTTREDH